MRSFLAVSALLLCTALAAASVVTAENNLFGFQCQTCLLGMQSLHLRSMMANTTADVCSDTWTVNKCALAHARNRTAYDECSNIVAKLCAAATSNGDNSAAACTSTGFCGPNEDAYPPTSVLHIWGECGGCQDLFTLGIQKSESFVCDGLTKPIAAYCNAAAPVCAFVLSEACTEIVGHFVDAGACSTDICYHFHACGSPAQSPCVHA